MKGLALAIMLLSVYCLEGAVVEQKPEGEAPPQVPDITGALQEYAQVLSQYFTREVVPQERFEQLRTQAQAFAQQTLKPITDQMTETFSQFLESVKESVMKAAT
nr:apolipoprotein A-II-like [Pogona vitticeps]